jgi:Lipocalin-like domain
MQKVKYKNYEVLKNLLLFSSIVFLFSSCSKDTEVVGNWKLTDIDYSAHMATIDPALRESFQEMAAAQGANVINKTFFTFDEKGDLQIKSTKFGGGERIDKGAWRMNETKDSLYLQSADNEFFAIEKLSEDSLILNSSDRPYRKLTLIRQ